MSSTTAPFKLDDTVSVSRAALRESVIYPLVKQAEGIVAEVMTAKHGMSRIERFDNSTAYETFFRKEESDEVSSFVSTEAESSSDSADIAVWLFGPEREETPSAIYRSLSDALTPGGTLIIASEVPWPGKILASDEWGEYTSEETSAALIRAGFHDVESIIEGPFFRITKAKKSTSNAYRALIEAEQHLENGRHHEAEVSLNSITEQMDSAQSVREYALLIAACHDLAGRHEHALEALSEALTLDPRCARAMCGLGRIAAIKGDLESAQEFFHAALRCEPALVAGLHGMAIVQEASGDQSGAYQTMLTASDLRPKNNNFLSEAARLGNALGEMNDVARYIAHRFGKTTDLTVYGNEADGPGTPPLDSN